MHNFFKQIKFWFVKTVHLYGQKGQKSKLDYHMSMLFAYMAGGEGVGVRGFKLFYQKGSDFFLLAMCLCVCGGGGGGGQVQYLSCREKNKQKNNRPSSY